MLKVKKSKSPKIIQFFCVVLATVVFFTTVISGNLSLTGAASLAEIEEQIKAIENQIREYEARASELASQAATLANEVAKLEAEEAAIQSMIDLSQAKIDQLTEEIAINEKKIQDNRDALGFVIADKYLADNITTIERLASSESLSKFIDEEVKVSSVSQSLSRTVKEIKALKKELEAQKVEVEQILSEQNAQKEVLVTKRTERQNILEKTRGEEAAYQQLKSQSQSQHADLMAEQKRIMDEILSGGGSYGSAGNLQWRAYSGEQGCTGGYPYCGHSYPAWGYNDDWQLYQRECVSYAAWAAYNRFGKDVRGFQGMGNANQWPETAAALMGATINYTPAVGAVAIARPFYGYGHAMVVEYISGDGWVGVSQYNWAVTGQYSTMEIRADSVIYVHFRNR